MARSPLLHSDTHTKLGDVQTTTSRIKWSCTRIRSTIRQRERSMVMRRSVRHRRMASVAAGPCHWWPNQCSAGQRRRSHHVLARSATMGGWRWAAESGTGPQLQYHLHGIGVVSGARARRGHAAARDSNHCARPDEKLRSSRENTACHNVPCPAPTPSPCCELGLGIIGLRARLLDEGLGIKIAIESHR
jgi:hypothetical protein